MSLVACGSQNADSDVGSTQQALMPDTEPPEPGDPDDAAPEPPPPAPPPPTTTCTNVTHDGVCRRYCCTETPSWRRCGVLSCPATTPPPKSTGEVLPMK